MLAEVRHWQSKLGKPETTTPRNDPRQVITRTIGYLENRAKGTEMFWNDPDGAEAILRVRAAALSDDKQLTRHLDSRPGYPFTRRPRPPKIADKSYKS